MCCARQILIKWDTGGDGEISKSEFRKHSRNLGVVASTADLNECFDSIDEDGGGTLDVAELKVAFKEMASAAKASEGEEADMDKILLAQRKTVKQSQADMLKIIADELRRFADEDEAKRAQAVAAHAAQKALAETMATAKGAVDVTDQQQKNEGQDIEQSSQVALQELPSLMDCMKPPADD